MRRDNRLSQKAEIRFDLQESTRKIVLFFSFVIMFGTIRNKCNIFPEKCYNENDRHYLYQ